MKNIKTNKSTIYISNAQAFDKLIQSFQKEWSKVFVLVDENTMKDCFPVLTNQVSFFKNAEVIEIESGEENKTIEICFQLWSLLQEYGADKNALLVNLGGGLITDLGGFVASTYKRGIDFINIPTSLLAQVDASLGGKTGVNLLDSKNQIGVFNEPLFTFIDTDFLNTLPSNQLLSGKSEMLKHGLIADKKHWNHLKESFLLGDNNGNFSDLIFDSISIKNTIVLADPLEKGERKKLNFGHTIGHGIESCFLNQKKEITHGEAIAIGMICESYISNKNKILSNQDFQEIIHVLTTFFKKKQIEKKDFDLIIKYIHQDKKNTHEQINMTVIQEIGKSYIDYICSEEDIIESLNHYNHIF